MPDVIINVTPQPTVNVEVDVDNVASYYYELAKKWAISPDLVEQLDYSSKYYANLSKESADSILQNAGFIAVSQDLINIDNVAEHLTSIDSCANIATDISTLADISTDVSTLADIPTDITTVANIATDVSTCGNIATDISTLADISTDVTACVLNATDISTCADSIGNINICADNIPVIADKVSKTGDTMTGDLTIQKSTYTTYSSSYDEGGRLFVKDKNDNNVGTFAIFSNNSHNYAEMSLYDGNSSSAWFGINKTSASNSDEVNASSGVKQSITNWSFPSSRYEGVTLGATGTQYTAPADGYVYISGTQTRGSGYVFLENVSNGITMVCQPPNVSTFEIRTFIPVAKGQLYRVTYANVNIYFFRFIYANGEA